MNEFPKIIIDTDPGHDDALAIMLLVKSGKVDIQAVTTVSGNVDIRKTTNNAGFILDLLSLNVPLYSGSAKPIRKKPVFANVHGTSGLDGVKITQERPLTGNAVEKLIEIVKANPNQISIVVIGPQTNIARAFIKEPSLPGLIKELIIMGGAIDVPGNKSKIAEFNIFVDPEAAQIVFGSKTRKVLIPLDVCNQIPIFIDDFKKIKGSLKHPIVSMMKKFIKGIEKFEGTKGALIYDALAAYYLIRPEAFKFKCVNIRVETENKTLAGRTSIDNETTAKKTDTKLVTQIDKVKFTQDFIQILSG